MHFDRLHNQTLCNQGESLEAGKHEPSTHVRARLRGGGCLEKDPLGSKVSFVPQLRAV